MSEKGGALFVAGRVEAALFASSAPGGRTPPEFGEPQRSESAERCFLEEFRCTAFPGPGGDSGRRGEEVAQKLVSPGKIYEAVEVVHRILQGPREEASLPAKMPTARLDVRQT